MRETYPAGENIMQCKICGRMVESSKEERRDDWWLSCYCLGLSIEDDMPSLLSSLCDSHVSKFAGHYRRKHSFRYNKKAQWVSGRCVDDKDVVEWVANQINIVAARIRKGMSVEICRGLTHNKYACRCLNWAVSSDANDVPLCNIHIKMKNRKNLEVDIYARDRLKEVAQALLEGR